MTKWEKQFWLATYQVEIAREGAIYSIAIDSANSALQILRAQAEAGDYEQEVLDEDE